MILAVTEARTNEAEEYLTLEEASDIRHEYRNGEIVPMTGGTPAHNEVTRMFVFLLTAALRKQPYSIFIADQRLWVPTVNLYTYPDVMVTQRPPELKPDRKDTVINPILIGETLSESTQGYDRGDKFAHYRTIATFQEYVLLDQYRPRVEHYTKQSQNQWLLTEYEGLESRFRLASLEVDMALAELYEAVEF